MELGKGNMAVHTPEDTIEKLSMPHMVDFTKLALAFVVEMANPIHSGKFSLLHRQYHKVVSKHQDIQLQQDMHLWRLQ
jgi:hypothetical protein